MNVSVIGTGYVGLVTSVCLAERGHRVVCVDVDQAKVEQINRGLPPIYERGLEELLRRNIGVRLEATTDIHNAIGQTELSLIAVGTPFDGRRIDLTYIKSAAEQIGTALRTKAGYHLVAVKSTVVPGTTDHVVLPLLETMSGKKAGVDFGVGMNPEFLTEGEAVEDFMHPDRIVIGGIDKVSQDLQAALYEDFPDVQIIRTNNKTAEMIKYASNALLATLISFSNELGNLCAALGGVDIVDVMTGVHSSRYFTMRLPNGDCYTPLITSFLGAGCGFGGSCLPKDVKALVAHGGQIDVPMHLLNAVLQINERQTVRVLDLVKKHFPSLHRVQVAILGLAFRPDTNDMRESPAIPIIQSLLQEGASIRAYDPVANPEAENIFSGTEIRFCGSLREAVEGAQAVVLITRWEEFKQLPDLLADATPQPVVVDGRRMLDKHAFARYEGIGLS